MREWRHNSVRSKTHQYMEVSDRQLCSLEETSDTCSIGRPGQLNRYCASLRVGRSGDRILVGARFSVPVQTVSGSKPASVTMDIGSLPSGVKWQGRDFHNPHPPSGWLQEYSYTCTPSLSLNPYPANVENRVSS